MQRMLSFVDVVLSGNKHIISELKVVEESSLQADEVEGGSPPVVLVEVKGVVKEYLHSMGFDINKEVEIRECLHRPLLQGHNAPVKHFVFSGAERTDKEWLSGPHCSYENKFERIRDDGLIEDLKNMSRELNPYEVAVSRAKRNTKKPQ